MLYYSSIKRVFCIIIFNYDYGLIECQSHTKFKHYIWVFMTYITNYYRVIVYISNYSIVYYSYFFSFTYYSWRKSRIMHC